MAKEDSHEDAHVAGMDVSDLRKSKTGAKLERRDLDGDPMALFERWFRDACESINTEPNAMSLATVDEDNRPSVRTVLLKSFDEQGFVFFTNFESAKGREILGNMKAGLLFHWKSLRRQVRIRGIVEVVTDAEADALRRR